MAMRNKGRLLGPVVSFLILGAALSGCGWTGNLLSSEVTAPQAAPQATAEAAAPARPAPDPKPAPAAKEPPRSTASSRAIGGASYGPVAVVNDQIITGYDVSQRLRLMNAVSGRTATQDQALEALIEDALRLQAARRAGIDPSDDEVRAGFIEIARQNQRDPDQMRNFFASQGVASETLDAQMKAEVAWRNLIRQRYGARARVSEDDVEEAVGGQNAGSGEKEYLLAEIRFPIGAGGAEAAMAQARQVISELQSGGRFSRIARQRSVGPTASSGGDLGWVAASAMSPQTAQVVSLMATDRVSEPFVDGDDVVLIGLRGVRGGGGATTTQYDLAQLVVPAAPNAPQAEADAALARANQVRGQIATCEDIDARKGDFHPASGRIGAMTPDQMPGPVRDAISGLDTGAITEPVRSNDGFHVIIVCGKSDSGNDTERRRAANALRTKRLGRYSRSLLRELRREAVIERR